KELSYNNLVDLVAARGLFRRTAGIVVLDDYRSGILELSSQAARRFQIDEVVVGKLFSLQLFCRGQTFWGAARRNVQRRGLVGIFSVTQFLLAAQGDVHALRQYGSRRKGNVSRASRQTLQIHS